MKNVLKQEILECIEECFALKDAVKEDDAFDDMEIDSLDRATLFAELEYMLDGKVEGADNIDPSDFAAFTCVSDLLAYIENGCLLPHKEDDTEPLGLKTQSA